MIPLFLSYFSNPFASTRLSRLLPALCCAFLGAVMLIHLSGCSAVQSGGNITFPISATKPANLTVISGQSVAVLNWAELSISTQGLIQLAGYNVYRSTVTGRNHALVATIGTTMTYADRGVSNNTTYYYVVKARDTAGNLSQFSDEVSVVPTQDTVAPATPAGLTATSANTTAKLTWTLGSEDDLTGYLLYRQGPSDPAPVLIATLGRIANYNDTGLTLNQTYAYILKARDAAGNISPSTNAVSLELTTDTTAPNQIQNLAASPGSAKVTLTWNASTATDLAKYTIYRSTVSGSGYTLVSQILPSTLPSFTDGGVLNNTAYYYTITATDESGNESIKSQEVTVTPGRTLTPPNAPTALSAKATNQKAFVYWNGVTGSDVVGYQISRSTASSGPYGVVTNLVTAASYTDTTVSTGLTYYYVVKTIDNTENNSVSSNMANVTIVSADTPPGPPLTPSAQATNASILLTWTPSTDPAVQTYVIYRKTDSAASFSQINEVGNTVLQYTDQNTSGTTTYHYLIRSKDDRGNLSDTANILTVRSGTDTTAPDAPTSLSAVTGETQVILNWTKSIATDTYQYQILRRNLSTDAFSTVAMVSASLNTYTNTGLTGGVRYSYVIKAMDYAQNTSAASSEVTVFTSADITPPAAPTPLAPLSQGGHNVLSWTPNSESDLDHYLVYRSTVSGGPYQLIRQTADTTYTDITVTANISYYYVFKAVDKTGNQSVNSAQVNILGTADTTPPSTPVGLTGTIGNQEVYLTWTAVANPSGDLAGYSIYRQNGSAWDLIQTLAAITTYTHTSLTNGTTYLYAIRSRDNAGNFSALSSSVSVTPTSNLLAPENFAGTSGDAKVQLTWTLGTDADLAGYTLYRSTTSGGPYTALITLGPITSYIDTTVSNDIRYYYVLQTRNSRGKFSLPSSEISLVPIPDRTPPAVPSGLAGITGIVEGGISLSWHPVGDIDLAGYLLYRSLTSGSGYALIAQTGVSLASYADTGLTTGTPYYYVVKSKDTSGNISAASTELAITAAPDTTPPNPTAMPTGVTGNAAAKLTWTGIIDTGGDLNNYAIFRGTDGISYANVATTNKTILTYLDAAITNGTTYYYLIKTQDQTGNLSAASPSISLTPRALSAPTAVTTQNISQKIQLAWAANPEAGVQSYAIYRRPTANTTFSLVATTHLKSYDDSAISTNVLYYYVIKAVDFNNSQSPSSSVVSATAILDVTPPAIPANLTATTGNMSASLAWSFNTDNDLAGYRLYRSTAGGPYERIQTLDPLTGRFLDQALSNGVTYNYAITAFDQIGNESALSNPVTLSLQNTGPVTEPIGERSQRITYQDVIIEWSVLADVNLQFFTDLVVTINAPTTGWIGIALNAPPNAPSGTSIAGSNYIVGYANGADAVVSDQYGDSDTTHKADILIGGQDNIKQKSGSEANGRSIINFKIPLNSRDLKDNSMDYGLPYKWLIDYGPNGSKNLGLTSPSVRLALDVRL